MFCMHTIIRNCNVIKYATDSEAQLRLFHICTFELCIVHMQNICIVYVHPLFLNETRKARNTPISLQENGHRQINLQCYGDYSCQPKKCSQTKRVCLCLNCKCELFSMLGLPFFLCCLLQWHWLKGLYRWEREPIVPPTNRSLAS